MLGTENRPSVKERASRHRKLVCQFLRSAGMCCALLGLPGCCQGPYRPTALIAAAAAVFIAVITALRSQGRA
jgi:hypothetical protein